MSVTNPCNDDDDLRLLLIGKTSLDNDSTVNTILGRYDMEGFTVVKKPTKVDFSNGEFLEKRVSIVNTPGLMDVRSNNQTPDDIKAEINKIVTECEKGFNAVLVITSYPIRWTYEEAETARYVKQIIKDDNISKCGILVITNGKGITSKGNNYEEAEQYFHSYIQKQLNTSAGGGFKQYLSLFNGRYIFLDNENDQSANMQQLSLLRGMIKPNVNFSLFHTGMSLYSFWKIVLGILTGIRTGMWNAISYIPYIRSLADIPAQVLDRPNQTGVRYPNIKETYEENDVTKLTLEDDAAVKNRASVS